MIEDNIFTLKYDLQQCIANNIQKLEEEYSLLLFEKQYMKLAQSLKCFENIEISPCGSKMKLKGEIAKDLNFTDEELQKVKSIVWQQNLTEIMYQTSESKKTQEQKELDKLKAQEQLSQLLIEKQNEKHKVREPQLKERRLIKKIKKELSKIGIELEYTEDNDLLMLSANVMKLKLNKNQLRTLINYASKLDVFIISPIYEENYEEEYIDDYEYDYEYDYLNEYAGNNENINQGDKCIGIRIALGIDLIV